MFIRNINFLNEYQDEVFNHPKLRKAFAQETLDALKLEDFTANGDIFNFPEGCIVHPRFCMPPSFCSFVVTHKDYYDCFFLF